MGKTVSTTWKRGNRTVVPGTEISVRGLRGRLKFRQHVVLDDGREWIDLVGDTGFHSVRPGRVKTVHRVSKMRPTTPRRTWVDDAGVVAYAPIPGFTAVSA